jgi:putative PIN family toxin of toxin-antitoxin system
VRIVPDTNILISAAIWGGNPASLLEAGVRGEVEFFISPSILDETTRILRRKGIDQARIDVIVEFIQAATTEVTASPLLNVVPGDPKDDHIVAAAVAAKAEAIVTGDKHLLRMGSYEGISMLTPADLLRLLGKQAGHRR